MDVLDYEIDAEIDGGWPAGQAKLTLVPDGQVVLLGRALMTASSGSPEFQIALSGRPSRVLINACRDVLTAETTCFEEGRRVKLGFD